MKSSTTTDTPALPRKLTFKACLAAYRELLKGDHPSNALALGRGRCVVQGAAGLFGAKRLAVPVESSAFALDEKDWDAKRGCWIGESPEDTLRFIEQPIFISVTREADMPAKPKAEKSWASQRYDDILKQARERYGRGWDHMSADQRENFIAARVLYLVLGQDGEKFAPAQAMVSDVYAVHNERKESAE